MVKVKFDLNRKDFLLVGVIVLLLGVGFAYAYNSNPGKPSAMGHSANEVEVNVNGKLMNLQQAIDGGLIGGLSSLTTFIHTISYIRADAGVRASKYCDVNGNNCKTINQLGSSGPVARGYKAMFKPLAGKVINFYGGGNCKTCSARVLADGTIRVGCDGHYSSTPIMHKNSGGYPFNYDYIISNREGLAFKAGGIYFRVTLFGVETFQPNGLDAGLCFDRPWPYP